jgi:hypothetical protein
MEYPKELIAIVEANEAIETIYLNESGSWLFAEREGFTNVVTRAEMLTPKTMEKETKVKTSK